MGQNQMAKGFQVFINHRGPDVKNIFASHIYSRLTQYHKLRVFFDKKEIPVGHDIAETIENAIQSASVHIAIFSKGYAESKWCLNELDSILKSKKAVIPVFWDVQPMDLRCIEGGCYKDAFEQYQKKEERFSEKVIENWRNALNKASHLSGLLFKTEDDHADLLNDIVSNVLKALERGPFDVAKAVDFQTNEILKQSEVHKNNDDLTVHKVFIIPEFALTHESGEDGPDLTELFEAHESGPDLTELFEADEDGPDLSDLFEAGPDPS